MASCDVPWLFICPIGVMESGLGISKLSTLLYFFFISFWFVADL